MGDDVGQLKLKPGEYVQVGDAVVTYVEQHGESVYLVFEAPRSVPIVRSKLLGAPSVRDSRGNGRSA